MQSIMQTIMYQYVLASGPFRAWVIHDPATQYPLAQQFVPAPNHLLLDLAECMLHSWCRHSQS